MSAMKYRGMKKNTGSVGSTATVSITFDIRDEPDGGVTISVDAGPRFNNRHAHALVEFMTTVVANAEAQIAIRRAQGLPAGEPVEATRGLPVIE